MNIHTFSITDLRHKTKKVLQKASEEGLVYLVRHSKAEAALVDIDYLNSLREAYEDYLDILEFDEATKEVKQKGRIALEKFEKKNPS